MPRSINAAQNLASAHIASGFGFWDNTAGFDISQTLIDYSASTSTFGRAFWVGLLNTLLVSGIGIVIATVLGFAVGLARLSRNWLVSRLAGGYVETDPQRAALVAAVVLVQFRPARVAAGARQRFASRRRPSQQSRACFCRGRSFFPALATCSSRLLLGIAASVVWRLWARRRQDRTGEPMRILWAAFGFIVVMPFVVYLLAGAPLSFSIPKMGRFNVMGGVEILPEFAALLLALSVYTAAFIAEVVRAGVLAVAHGQTEAAQALGLASGTTLRLVVVPQAMRVILPPLTSQYLNLIKNSSLAVAIGYPDLVQVFAGSVLNLTGQAVEVVAITMAVYLFISLVTSFLMNLYGYAIAVEER